MSEAPAGIEVGSVGFSGPDASGHFGPYGGVFVGAHHCTIGSGTSEDAKRVWKSLAREYNASGDVIFVRTN